MIPAIIGIGSTLLLLGRNDAPKPIIDSLSSNTDDIEIPFKLMRKQWLDFLKVAAVANPHAISPAFKLGTFELTIRRLCDLGAMKNPEITDFRGKRVWNAEWVNPKNLREFQDAPMLQYKLFLNSLEQYMTKKQITEEVGRIIDGIKTTMSGLLIVAHRAGISGFDCWISSEKNRKRFSENTTSFFNKANGIF